MAAPAAPQLPAKKTYRSTGGYVMGSYVADGAVIALYPVQAEAYLGGILTEVTAVAPAPVSAPAHAVAPPVQPVSRKVRGRVSSNGA